MSQQNQMIIERSDQAMILDLINRFKNSGFESLTAEDLALCITITEFPNQFKLEMGVDWKDRYEKMALDKIHKQSIDISWIKQQQTDNYNQFFTSINKGDFEGVKAFIRSQKDINYLKAVDSLKRSALHLACKEKHQHLVEFFVQKGFDVNSRDKSLKTPLHYACLSGCDNIVDYLVNNGAQIQFKDKNGATCFHYACASSSVSLIKYLINLFPTFTAINDFDQRTGFFYAIWNSSNKQVEILRVLIENNSNINHKDINKRTPLHHCSLSGNSRAIPILCQKGAITTEKDKDGKTCLEVCLNDRIREMILVYSNPKQGTKSLQKSQNIIKVEEPQKNEVQIKNQIQEDLRNQFYLLMKQIQENGIIDKQHIKKPYLYTGSWMEGVSKIDQLYERIIDIQNPCEAFIRAFNILCPYQQQLPKSNGNEQSTLLFFGDYEQQKIKQINENQIQDNNNNLQQQLEIEKSRSAQFEQNSINLQEQFKILQDQKNELQKNLDLQLQQQNKEKNFEKHQQFLEQIIQQQNKQIQEYQDKLDTMISKDTYEKVLIEKEELKQQFEEQNINYIQKCKKIGKIFLNAINNKKQIIINENTNEEYYMQDDDCILSLYNKLKNNPPPLSQRMLQVKKNGILDQNDFSNLLQNLNLNQFEIQAILRACGFFNEINSINFDQLQYILQQRPIKREQQEKILFNKIIDEIYNVDLDLNKYFQLYQIFFIFRYQQ